MILAPGVPERGTKEYFTEILCSHRAEEKFRELKESGELKALFPEIEAMAGVTQPPEFHPEGDVFEHTMIMLRHMAYPDPFLGWSVLLHDVGKPLTLSVESSGRIRFFGHEEKGAGMAEQILRRFGFEEDFIEVVVHAVRYHMRFASVREMRRSKLEGVIKAPFFAVELELHRLDCISCHGRMEGFDHLLAVFLQMAPSEPEKLVSGKDLLAKNIAPGKDMGNILEMVRQAQLAGTVTTRSEALDYIDKLIKKG